MYVFRDYRQAKKHLPSCLIGSGVDDFDEIEDEARLSACPPLDILRGLVRIELDLIEERQDTTAHYKARDIQAIREYFDRLPI